MKKVLTLIILLVGTTSFCMDKKKEPEHEDSGEQAALSELQKLTHLAEAKEKESDRREREKLELKKRALALKEQRLSLAERKVRALEVIAMCKAEKFMCEAADPELKARYLKEKLKEAGVVAPIHFLENGHEFDSLVAAYPVVTQFLIQMGGAPAHSDKVEQEQ